MHQISKKNNQEYLAINKANQKSKYFQVFYLQIKIILHTKVTLFATVLLHVIRN